MPAFTRAQDVLETAVRDSVFPGAVAVIGTKDEAHALGPVGVRRYGGAPTTPDTRYDLASLTKVVSTLPLVLALVGDGKLSLGTPLGELFSNAGWFQTPSIATITLRTLLTHTSGLSAWTPLFASCSTRLACAGALLQTRLEHPPGTLNYSDLGFMLLGLSVERVTRMRQDAALAPLLARLELTDTGYGPLEGVPVAATEDCGWRNVVLEGVVHDENAFAMAGVAGHAGLFGTAQDVARYAQAWLRRDPALGPAAFLEEAASEQATGQVNGERVRRGLGWLLAGENPFAGKAATREGFGHTGFTGTSVWLEPERNWFAVLLSNRVHPSRRCGERIHAVRQAFHEAVAAEIA